MTSAPVRAASAATTELSTPPDMATTMRACRSGPGRSKLTDIKVSLPEFHSCRLERPQAEAQQEPVLARHEGDFRTGAEEPLSLNELLALLGDGADRGDRSREDAIACYLSAGEGWREAMKRLRGALAAEAPGGEGRKGGEKRQ